MKIPCFPFPLGPLVGLWITLTNPLLVAQTMPPGITPLFRVSDWPGYTREGFRSVGVYSNSVIGISYSGAEVVDFSDPARPRRTASINHITWGTGDFVLGHYVLMFEIGLRVFDVQRPDRPVQVAALPLAFGAGVVAVNGNYAYATDSSVSGDRLPEMHIIDLVDPAKPKLAGSVQIPAQASGMSVSGGLAFIPTYGKGAQIVDVTDPTLPRIVGVYLGAGSDQRGRTVFENKRVWLSRSSESGSNLILVDLSDPRNPREAGRFPLGEPPGDVLGGGNLLFVTSVNGSLLAVDVSSPSQPVLLGKLDSAGLSGGVAAGTRLYLAASGGIEVIDVSDPARLRSIARYMQGLAQGVAVSGNYVYLADDGAGLQVLDYSNPYRPRHLMQHATAGAARDVVLAGKRLWLAHDSGIQVLDVTTPENPALLREFPASNAVSLAQDGEFILAAGSGSRLRVFRTGGNELPAQVAELPLADGVARVAASEGLAAAAAGKNGWYVVDLADPLHPVEAGHFTGTVIDVAMRGRYAFAVEASTGLHIFDLLDPKNPRWVKSVAGGSGEFPQTVCVAGTRAYLAVVNKGVDMYDVRDPAQTSLLASLSWPASYVRQVAAVGDFVYVASQRGGLGLYGPRTGLEAELIAEFLFDGDTLDRSGRGAGLVSMGKEDALWQNRLALSPEPPKPYIPEIRAAFGVPNLAYASFTVGVDFKPAPDASTSQPIVIGGQYRRWLWVGLTNGGFEVRFNDSALRHFIPATLASRDEWQQLLCSVNTEARRVLLFLNGSLVGQAPLPEGFQFESVGARWEQGDKVFTFIDWNEGKTFRGLLDNLRVFRRALTEEEAVAFARAHPVFDFAPAELDVSEGAAQAGLTLRRFGRLDSSQTLEFSTIDFEARAGQEFRAASGVLTFLPGEASKSIPVDLLNDSTQEQAKALWLDVWNLADGAPLASAVVRIQDNDPGAGFTRAEAEIDETAGLINVTVLRGDDGNYPVSIDYTVSPITATPLQDYLPSSGTLTFEPGETAKPLVVAIQDDSLVEKDEQFEVRLSNPRGGARLGPIASVKVTVHDNELPAPEVALDTSFRSSGALQTDADRVYVSRLLPQPDGKVIVAGTFRAAAQTPHSGVARLLPDGALDAAFAPQIEYPQPEKSGWQLFVAAAALQPDGKIVLGGQFTVVNGTNRAGLARLNPDGSLDASFDAAGGFRSGSDPGSVSDLAVQPDGKVVVGGRFDTVAGVARAAVARLEADGRVDAGFVPAISGGVMATCLAVASDGKVLVGVFSNSGAVLKGVVRLNADGTLDTAFDTGAGLGNRNKAGAVTGIQILPDGKVLIGGPFTSIGGIPRFGIARLLPDGTVDSTFDAGRIAVDLEGTGWVPAFAAQDNGKVLIAGYPSASSASMARLNADGSLDSSFNVPSWAAACPPCFVAIQALALEPGGGILVGGPTRGSSAMAGVARLFSPAPMAVAFARTSLSASEGDAEVIFNVQRLGESSSNVSVGYVSKDVTAKALVDYVPQAGTLTFGPFETRKSFTVALLNDSAVEQDKIFQVELTNASPGVVIMSPGLAEVKLMDNDRGFEFSSAPSLTVEENAGTLELKVLRGSDPGSAVSVQFYSRDGSALTGQDYTSLSGTLNFAPGEMEKTLTLAIIDDTVAEPDEQFSLVLGNPSPGNAVGQRSVVSVNIRDNDPTIRLVTNLVVARESDGVARIDVLRERGTGIETSVDYTTRDAGARAGVDYTAVSGTLTFQKDEIVKTISIPILNDGELEESERLELALVKPGVEVTLGSPSVADIQIIDDDNGFEFEVSPMFGCDESVGQVELRVLRGADVSTPNSVEYHSADGNALAGADYIAVSGRLTFAPEEKVKVLPVSILEDLLPEGEEQFSIQLTNPSAGSRIGARSQVTVTIHDNEPTVRFSSAGLTVQESDGLVRVGVIRGGPADRETSVDFFTRDDTAQAGRDYRATSGRLIFYKNEGYKTIDIGLLNDTQTEAVEQFEVLLANPSPGAGLVGPSLGTIQIRDDDIPTTVFSFDQPTYKVNELDGSATVTVVRSEPAVSSARVTVLTGVSTATPALDYQPVNTQLWFATGQTTTSVSIPILEDTIAESDEAVTLQLSDPVSDAGTAALGTPAVALLTIVNAGAAVEFTSAAYMLSETNRFATIVARRRGETNLPLTVAYRTKDQTAVAGRDYVAQSGSLSWAPGQATNGFAVPLLDNFTVDGPRSVELSLAEPSSGANLGPQATATLTILDDEQPVILDPSFVSVLAPDSTVSGMVVQPDGKIVLSGDLRLVTGEKKAMLRVQPEGLLDPTFREGIAGGATFTSVAALALDETGRILAAGIHSSAAGWFNVFRLLQDGTLDNAFRGALGGQQLTYLNSVALQVQPDGRILVAGERAVHESGAWKGIARLNPDGSQDSTFQPGAGATFSYPWDPLSRFGAVSAVAVQPDGKIVIGGRFTSYGGVPRGGVARLNADGSLDSAFDPGAGVRFLAQGDPGRMAWVNTLLLQADGRIVIGGSFNRVNGVERWLSARLNTDGSLDSSFTGQFPWGDQVFTLLEQPGGRIIVGGNFGTPATQGVARFTSNGVQDGTFAVLMPQVTALRMLPSGDLLAAGGFTSVNGVPQARLARLFSDTTARRSIAWSAPVYAVDENGTNAVAALLRGGDSREQITAALHLVDGTAQAGIDYETVTRSVTLEPGENLKAIRIPIKDDGALEGHEMFVANLHDPTPGVLLQTPHRAEIQINDDEVTAVPDLAFQPRLNGSVTALAIQGDEKLLIAGNFTLVGDIERNRLARLNRDGSLDLSFNIGPGFSYPDGGCCPSVRAILIQPDGKIVVGGDFAEFKSAPRPWLARLLPDGSLDETFTPTTDLASPVFGLVLQSDGKILVGAEGGLLRLHPDGARDAAFANGPSDGTVSVIRVLADGSILAGGPFSSWGNEPRWRVARLRSDGSLDAGYAPRELAVDRLLALSEKGEALVVGTVSNAENGERAAIVRLRPDGSVDSAFDPSTAIDQLEMGSVQAAVFDPEGGTLVAGYGRPASDGSRSTVIARLNADGSVDSIAHVVWVTGQGWGAPVAVLNLDPWSEKALAGGLFQSVEGRYQPWLGRFDFAHAGKTEVGFAETEVLATEGGVADIYVWRMGDVSDPTSVTLSAEVEGPNPGDWFTPFKSILAFAPLEKEKSLSFPLANDPAANAERRLLLTLSEATGGALLDSDRSVVRVLDLQTPGNLDLRFDAELENPPDWGAVSVGSVQSLNDGRLRIWGNFQTAHGVERNGFAHLNADGTIDSTETNWIASPSLHLLTMPDGKTVDVLVDHLVRRQVDGALDPSFNPSITPAGTVRTAVLAPDGRIIIAGSFQQVNGAPAPRIARLEADGALDPTFAPGEGPFDPQSSPELVALALQGDGRLIVGGRFSRFNQAPRDGLARLNTDGSIDLSFTPTTREGATSQNYVTSVLIQPDGKILVLGWLSFRTQAGRPDLARLNADGTVDRSFVLTGVPAIIQTWGSYPGNLQVMAFGPDASVYVAGEFTRFGSAARAGIIRVSLGTSGLERPVVEAVAVEAGVFRMTFHGETGQSYRIESSADLITWTPAGEVIAETASVEFKEVQVPGRAQRFYRVRRP